MKTLTEIKTQDKTIHEMYMESIAALQDQIVGKMYHCQVFNHELIMVVSIEYSQRLSKIVVEVLRNEKTEKVFCADWNEVSSWFLTKEQWETQKNAIETVRGLQSKIGKPKNPVILPHGPGQSFRPRGPTYK